MGRKQGGVVAHPSSRAIAFAIRSKRREMGYTLRQLAEASGLSAAFLSQAERGLTTPSIVSLSHLASAMNVDVGYFISTPGEGHIVQRADNPQRLDFGSPMGYVRLTGKLPDHVMEALLVTVPPDLVLPTVTREGEGFYLVMEGRVLFTIGDEEFDLGVGDSAHFDQRQPYTMLNRSATDARVLWVGTPPLFD